MATNNLELNSNNLFINGFIVSYQDGSNDELLLRENLEIEGTTLDQYHTLTEGQDLDFLAWFYYKELADDPTKFWWVIADANAIFDPTDISNLVGKNLLIPELSRVLIEID